tara:strand:+ start:2217 stop:2405 length:189 start_codon:yes stop_codon:yes gene_type:complete
MEELKKNGVYHIRVTNLVDKSVWIHKRVPAADVSCIALNKNLKVEVIKLVRTEETYTAYTSD